MPQSIFKTGNSLAVSIPFRIVKQMGLQKGQPVIVKYRPEQGQIILEFPDRIQPSLAIPSEQ